MVSLTDYEATKRVIYQMIRAWPNDKPVALSLLRPDETETVSAEELKEGLRRMISDNLVEITDNGLFVMLTAEGRNEAELI
jgi:hypothetical protein